MNLHVPYHKPHLDAEDRRGMHHVMSSGWLTTGKEAKQFEDEFKRTVGSEVAIAMSSCTAALHIALELLDLRQGDEVIVPTMTFTASAAAVKMAGGVPVIADVDKTWLTLTPEMVLPHLTPRTRAIMPVHYGGNPSGYQDILALAEKYHYAVIDDAAHAFPAETPRGMVGGRGQSFATAFSFYATKTMTTAEGGMLTLADPSLESRARRLTLHGIDQDAFQRSRTAIYHYEVLEHGFKYNLPDLLAALGRTQLKKAISLWELRVMIAETYGKRLQYLHERGLLQLPSLEQNVSSAWHLYPVRFNLDALTKNRDELAAELRLRGVGSSVHYRPLHRHSYWAANFIKPTQVFPFADRAYDELLSLPIWPGMTTIEMEYVVDRVGDVIIRAKR